MARILVNTSPPRTTNHQSEIGGTAILKRRRPPRWCLACCTALWATLVCTVAANGQCDYTAEVLSDQPVAFYRFEEVGGSIAKDSSGNNRHGAYQGGASNGAAGLFGTGSQAACFDGVNDYVDITNPIFGTTWQSLTVEAWVKISQPTTDFAAVVSSKTGGTMFHFQLFSAGNIIVYSFPNAVSFPIMPQPSDGVWHHFAMVAASGASRVYFDGAQVGPTVTTAFTGITPASDNQMSIARGFQNGRYLRGCMDEVAVYNTALSPARIAAHYQAGRNGIQVIAPPTSLIACPDSTVTIPHSAAAVGAFTIAWRKDGDPIEDIPGHRTGTHGPTLTITNVTDADGGAYECVVTNACGSVTTSTLVSLCPPDINCDGTLDSGDYLAFLLAFAGAEPLADRDGSGDIDSGDYLAFLLEFAAGC